MDSLERPRRAQRNDHASPHAPEFRPCADFRRCHPEARIRCVVVRCFLLLPTETAYLCRRFLHIFSSCHSDKSRRGHGGGDGAVNGVQGRVGDADHAGSVRPPSATVDGVLGPRLGDAGRGAEFVPRIRPSPSASLSNRTLCFSLPGSYSGSRHRRCPGGSHCATLLGRIAWSGVVAWAVCGRTGGSNSLMTRTRTMGRWMNRRSCQTPNGNGKWKEGKGDNDSVCVDLCVLLSSNFVQHDRTGQ